MEDELVIGDQKETNKDCVQKEDDPMIMEEYEIEELSVDGICGVY
ncbi:MAG: variant-type mycofactocin precursor [Thermodesulfobacteriota bacterium]